MLTKDDAAMSDDWNDLYSLTAAVAVVGTNDAKTNDENDYYYCDDSSDCVNVIVTVTVNGCVNANVLIDEKQANRFIIRIELIDKFYLD